MQLSTPFQASDPISLHIRRQLRSTLGRYAKHIEAVDVSTSPVHSNRFGDAPKDTTTRLTITLKSHGTVIACGTAGDICLSVSRAAADAKVAVGRQLARPSSTNRPRPKNRSP
jgi:hypothetical protein